MKKIVVISLFSLFVSMSINAQLTIATDFTIIDTDGNTFNLFNNLDSGNAVILEFWYAGCAFCGAASEYLQTIWEQHGSGSQCLKVLGLHIAANENLQAVLNYKDTHNITFPLFYCGTNNANTYYILMNYANSGTVPRFIIIKPDKSIIHNSISYPQSAIIDTALKYTFCQNSINDLKYNDKINIYPNPTKEWLNISNTEKGIIHIYNVLGEEAINIKCNEGDNTVNVSKLTAGSYTIKIVSEKNVVTKKLIVND